MIFYPLALKKALQEMKDRKSTMSSFSEKGKVVEGEETDVISLRQKLFANLKKRKLETLVHFYSFFSLLLFLNANFAQFSCDDRSTRERMSLNLRRRGSAR